MECYGKVCYASEAIAHMVLADIRQKANWDKTQRRRRSKKNTKWKPTDKRKEQRTYLCPRCSFWHLTSKSVEEYKNSKANK